MGEPFDQYGSGLTKINFIENCCHLEVPCLYLCLEEKVRCGVLKEKLFGQENRNTVSHLKVTHRSTCFRAPTAWYLEVIVVTGL